jgi:plasmid stability protein
MQGTKLNEGAAMATVTIRKLSDQTKGALVQRALRNRHSLEEELRQILDATARVEAENPDMQEPFGDWLVRISRPGYDDFAEIMDRVVAERKSPDRPLPTFG